MVTVVYCLTVNFPKLMGMRFVEVDKYVDKKCYLESLKTIEGYK